MHDIAIRTETGIQIVTPEALADIPSPIHACGLEITFCFSCDEVLCGDSVDTARCAELPVAEWVVTHFGGSWFEQDEREPACPTCVPQDIDFEVGGSDEGDYLP